MEGVVLLLSYLIKWKRITTNTVATTTPPIPPAIGSILLIWDSNVLLPSYLIRKCIISPVWGSSREDCTTTIYLIKMIRITTNTIATITPLIPPAIWPILLFSGSCGGGCTSTILPDKEDKDHYQHYSHYYSTNTSCYRTNITCLRLLWRGLYFYYLTW